ncbi:hypothetical protein CEXT_416841 [Caerostris extrusa]|uniref:Uncharacterized protein n=1 Tax=Caerostris extrusa TaxID=172846 RepID=A0AAV4SN31_CAEEX|nr:hypothetical protein CEXT_416841 [Caerostris extrusa]
MAGCDWSRGRLKFLAVATNWADPRHSDYIRYKSTPLYTLLDYRQRLAEIKTPPTFRTTTTTKHSFVLPRDTAGKIERKEKNSFPWKRSKKLRGLLSSVCSRYNGWVQGASVIISSGLKGKGEFCRNSEISLTTTTTTSLASFITREQSN